MRPRFESAALEIILSMLALATAGAATAATCGGLPPACGGTTVDVCHCGDTVTADYILDHDIDDCAPGAPVGLRIASGVTVSAAPGVAIEGTGSGIGVLFDNVSGASLIGVDGNPVGITGWKIGVQLFNGAHHNVLRYVHAHHNITGSGASGDYGIDLRSETSALTTSNRLENVIVEANGDEGVHLGGGSSATRITDSLVVSNLNQQIYLANSNDNWIEGTAMVGVQGGLAALRVSNSNNNVLNGNSIHTGNLMFSAGSTNNYVLGQTVIRQGRLIFKPGKANTAVGSCAGSTPTTTPHDNFLAGLDIAGTTNGCVVFETSSCSDANQQPHRNYVTNSTLRCTGSTDEGIYDIRSEIAPGGNVGTYVDQNIVCSSQCLIDPTTGTTGATRACLQGVGGDTQDGALQIITVNSSCS